MGEGELGLPGDIGAPGMGGVEEVLPATTGYNPALGTGYVPPGGVQEEPDQLPQGAGLTDTSGGNTPTLWARNQYLMANPGSTSPSDQEIFSWMQATGTPNTEAMRVGHKLVLELIQMLVELIQIQISNLGERCLETRAAKMRTVEMKAIL
jgi:hypothetical protein